MSQFNDDTPMPWGKHAGKKMSEVPDSYLLWLWENPAIDKSRHVELWAYIRINLDAIQENIKRAK